MKERDRLLKQALNKKIAEIALHGFDHKSVRKIGRYSEFDGVPFSDQIRKIKKGKKILEEAFNVPVITFLPPWDSYDYNTVKSVSEAEMKVISVSKGQPVVNSNVKFLPCLCSLIEFDKGIKDALSINGTKIIVIRFHHFTFFESRADNAYADLKALENVVARVSKDPNLIVMTLGDAAKELASELSNERHKEAQRYYNLIYRHMQIPLFGQIVEKFSPQIVYFPINYYRIRNHIALYIGLIIYSQLFLGLL